MANIKAMEAKLVKLNAQHQDLQLKIAYEYDNRKKQKLDDQDTKVWKQIIALEDDIKKARAKQRAEIIARDPNHLHPNTPTGYRGKSVAKVLNEKGKTYTTFVHQKIDEYTFTPHVLQRMQERGIYSSQAIDTVRNGKQEIDPKNSAKRNYFLDNITVTAYIASGHIIYVNHC